MKAAQEREADPEKATAKEAVDAKRGELVVAKETLVLRFATIEAEAKALDRELAEVEAYGHLGDEAKALIEGIKAEASERVAVMSDLKAELAAIDEEIRMIDKERRIEANGEFQERFESEKAGIFDGAAREIAASPDILDEWKPKLLEMLSFVQDRTRVDNGSVHFPDYYLGALHVAFPEYDRLQRESRDAETAGSVAFNEPMRRRKKKALGASLSRLFSKKTDQERRDEEYQQDEGARDQENGKEYEYEPEDVRVARWSAARKVAEEKRSAFDEYAVQVEKNPDYLKAKDAMDRIKADMKKKIAEFK